MPAYARAEIVTATDVGIYHCSARCVRRAFLCGRDSESGRNYEHRREWIESRLEVLAGVYAVDVCGFAILGNHLHVILRQRPDIAKNWSDQQIARRWWNLLPGRRDEETGAPAEPETHELAMLMANKELLAERRTRLGSLSWFMRSLCEPIARQANVEDGCRGRFWEGRFKSQILLTESAVLACSVYVDLNPIRAGTANTPETSGHTSVQRRIRGEADRQRIGKRTSQKSKGSSQAGKSSRAADAWLCPVEIDEQGAPETIANAKLGTDDQAGSHSSRKRRSRGDQDLECRRPRATDQGFLPLSLPTYLALVAWTGKQIRREKRDAIPAEFKPLMESLSLDPETWVDCVQNFGRWFHRAVGTKASMAVHADSSGKMWFSGFRKARATFG